MGAMYRLAAAIILSSVAFAQNALDPAIVRTAKSPFDLATYVDSHFNIDWKPMRSLRGHSHFSKMPTNRKVDRMKRI